MTTFTAPLGQNFFFKVLGKTADNSLGRFDAGSVNRLVDTGGVILADFQPDGRLLFVPLGIGTAVVTVSATVDGVDTINGTLTVTITESTPPVDPELPPAVTIELVFDSFQS